MIHATTTVVVGGVSLTRATGDGKRATARTRRRLGVSAAASAAAAAPQNPGDRGHEEPEAAVLHAPAARDGDVDDRGHEHRQRHAHERAHDRPGGARLRQDERADPGARLDGARSVGELHLLALGHHREPDERRDRDGHAAERARRVGNRLGAGDRARRRRRCSRRRSRSRRTRRCSRSCRAGPRSGRSWSRTPARSRSRTCTSSTRWLRTARGRRRRSRDRTAQQQHVPARRVGHLHVHARQRDGAVHERRDRRRHAADGRRTSPRATRRA